MATDLLYAAGGKALAALQTGDQAAAKIRAAVPDADLKVAALDLGSLQSVRTAAAQQSPPKKPPPILEPSLPSNCRRVYS